MGMPQHSLSTTYVAGVLFDPDDRVKTDLEDFELGGIALNDASSGLDYQVWHLTYNDDDLDVNYGDFTLTPETTGSPVVVLNVIGVNKVALAFDQNCRAFIAYMLEAGGAKFWWYDSALPGTTTTDLPAGTVSIAACLDDKRATQVNSSDILLAYISSGTLYYLEQRDRYATAYPLIGGVGGAVINTMGMTDKIRVEIDVDPGDGIPLCQIVTDLCTFVDVTDINVSVLCPIKVRGFISANMYTAADAIRSLQIPYFFDMPEIDAKLVAVLRGGATVASIPYDDLVVGQEVQIETAREQGIEYPRKLHLAYESAEADYTPTKETSERRSPDVRVLGEVTVQAPINFLADEAASRADAMHKVAWAEQEGKVNFGVDESWARLVPSDPIIIEIRPGTTKRVRIIESAFSEGMFLYETVIDRQSSYSSEILGAPRQIGTPPPPTISSLTTWEYLDIPTLKAVNDDLHYYVVGHGDPLTAWTGAQLQREIAGQFENEATIATHGTMGLLIEALPAAPAEFIDNVNTILVNTNNALMSVTADQILAGANMVVIVTGGAYEIIQYQNAVDEAGDWRLSILTRGRYNTTPILHAIGDSFVSLSNPVKVPASPAIVDTTIRLRAPSFGELPTTGIERDVSFTGRSQTEWAPVSLIATQNGNDWVFSWTPRTRLGSAANPIVSLYFIGWRLEFTVGGTTGIYEFADSTMTNPNFTYTEAQQIADFGSAQGTLDVVLAGTNSFTGIGDTLSETV